MGHDSQNLLSEDDLKCYRGAVLSPVNYTEEKVISQIKRHASDQFEMIFDPQLYYPHSDRGELPDWSYFPADVDTADQSSITWWKNLTRDVVECVKRLQPHTVCSPIIVPRIYSDEYYDLNREVASNLKEQLSKESIDVLHNVLVRPGDLANKERAAEIASIVSRGTPDRVLLVLISDVEPRREFHDPEELKGAMCLIRYLENSEIRVLVGFTSSDILLWKIAGATDCATGKFFNVRRFTPSRWDVHAEGGGQLPYWFEESLLAYLRESDLVRVREAGLLSEASASNPYGEEILQQINSEPEKAWLGLSWRQYMYWFGDFEERFVRGMIDTNEFLKNAESVWSELDDRNILMEERQNDGSWLRAWRRAVIEAFRV
jgi:hypothetical protein